MVMDVFEKLTCRAWRLVCVTLILLGLAYTPNIASASEQIISFDSKVQVLEAGTMDVRDTISFRAERRQIKRGIYRDFDMYVELADGSWGRVSYDILSITRDGKAEPFHTERFPDSMRLFIGDANVLLPVGEHTYEIHYQATRQITYLPDHDLIYWNVTGNFWDFPIQRASIELSLPAGGLINDVKFFTGRFGETSGIGTLNVSPQNDRFQVTTNTAMQPGEGLTISARLEKGTVAGPTQLQRAIWYVLDNLENIGSALILMLVSAYYLFTWLRIGRDPPAGVIVPSWSPPKDISPALANYIENHGFSGNPFTAMSAAIINLSVKGHVTIDKIDEEPEISALGLAGEPSHSKALPTGEAALLARISQRDSFKIAKSNGKSLKSAVSRFRQAIEREHRNVFFNLNRGFCILGIALSVIGFVLLIIASGGSAVSMLPVLLVAAVFLAVVVFLALGIVKTFKMRGRRRWLLLISLLPLGMSLSALHGIGFAIFNAFQVQSPMAMLSLLGLVFVNFLFFKLLQAPTAVGRVAMDQIAGLKTYLDLAEKDRMNLAGAPSMSPQHFETLLPYAVALNLEKPWSETFDNWLETATAEQRAIAQSSSWSNHSGSSHGLGNQLSRMSRTLEDGMRSSMPAPKSSSSSGGGFSSGGFSGGGGGSSGGGGW